MRAGLHILFFCLFGCQKAEEIQNPHFKELVGKWTTIADSEKQTVVIGDDGKITFQHSAERGGVYYIKEFYYGMDKMVINGDTLSSYLCLGGYSVEFYKKINSDSAYCSTSQKIDNQSVVGGKSLFVKVK